MTRTRLPLRGIGSAAGYSLVEAMVSTVLLSLAMGAGYSSLISQMRTHATQMMMADTENQARTALRVLADQMAMAGFGIPTASTPSVAPSLITAQATQLSFWTNVSAAHTYLTASALKNATAVTVLSTTGLKVGGSVYVTDTTDWYLGTVQGINGSTVTISPGLTYNFTLGSQILPVEQVTFQLAGNTLQRNGQTFISNVTGLTFTYDSQTLSAIRQITVTLSMQTRRIDIATGQKLAVSATTRIAPPNLAL